MYILYIHQHFAIPSGTTGTRSYEFARRWVAAGHKVTVITGHYDIGGLTFSSTSQVIDGIEVVIAGNRYSNKQSFLRRLFSFFSFTWFAFYSGFKQKDVDIVYATSTPLTIGIPAILLKYLKRVPFVFEVRDQWPAVPIALGYIKNNALKFILQSLEKIIYKSADAIVALSPGMAEGVGKVLGHSDTTIITVPNSCDLDRFNPSIAGNELRKEHLWDDKILFLHAGAVGKANGLDFIVTVANELKINRDIHFVIIGDGSEKDRLVVESNRLNLKNIDFLGSISKELLPRYFAMADVSMVIFANNPILEHNSANKFFDSLSAGKPVLLNYSGWQRKYIESNMVGMGVPQGSVVTFIQNVSTFANMTSNERDQYGINARKLAQDCFARDKLSTQVLDLLTSLNKG